MRELVMDLRVVRRGSLDQPSEKSRLCRGKVLRLLVEIRPRRRTHAVRAMPEIDAVQVHAEDLVLGIPLLERDRQHDLLHFSRHRFLRGKQLDLHQLLSDRAAPLVQPAGCDVDPCGARRRHGVDRAVVVEVAIFGREDGFGRVGAHLLELQRDVVVTGRTPVFDQLAVAIEHHHVARREHVLAGVRQVLDCPQHVQRGGDQQRSDRGGDPRLLGPQPCQRTEPGRLLAAASDRSG